MAITGKRATYTLKRKYSENTVAKAYCAVAVEYPTIVKKSQRYTIHDKPRLQNYKQSLSRAECTYHKCNTAKVYVPVAVDRVVDNQEQEHECTHTRNVSADLR